MPSPAITTRSSRCSTSFRPGITLAVRAQAERALAAFVKQHIAGRSEAVLREAPNVRNAILREAEKADLVVMGASASPGGADGETYLFGALPEAIAARARPTVMVVKTRETIERATFDQLAARAETLAAADRAAEEARAVPVRVERWFGESNFHHAEFADLRRLVTLKEKQKLTISLVLPTLNEEETIGPIVRRAMREMVGRVPLLDEVLVIDSASTDRTREIAEAEGARVVQHPDVLPRYGSFRGKGEALWKSLYETSGDIIVWADTDVKNWHPRMVYGTLGPLLHEPRLQYVKGYYQRPIVEDGVLKEGGGGRVTELVARPLINLFYPELSGMIQPLAGEYAGRRTLLESIPFFTGYAVEIGHLIDAAERLGIEGLGQVDLERRLHRNQELEGLSRMSFVILQAVMKRLEERRKARLFAEMGSTMKLPRSGKGRLSLEVIELADQERPPMIRIPEYLERHPRAAGVLDLSVIPAERRVTRAPALPRRPSCADTDVPRAADRPHRARFVQGLADVRRGRPGAGRRLGPRPAGRQDPALPARRRRRGHARGGRRGRRLAVAGRRPSTTRSAARSGPLAALRRRDAGGRRDGRGVRPVARRAGRTRRRSAATSAGTGDLIRAAIDAGARAIVLGIGGSATTDGGAGLLRALGAEADRDRASRDLAGLDPRLADVDLAVACDVSNPLLGPTGAAAVYGPQKGATPGGRRRSSTAGSPRSPTRSRRAAGRARPRRPRGRRGRRRRVRAARDPGPVPVVRAAARGRPRHGRDRLRRTLAARRPRHHRRGPDRCPDGVRQDRARCRPAGAGGGRAVHRGRWRRRARGHRGPRGRRRRRRPGRRAAADRRGGDGRRGRAARALRRAAGRARIDLADRFDDRRRSATTSTTIADRPTRQAERPRPKKRKFTRPGRELRQAPRALPARARRRSCSTASPSDLRPPDLGAPPRPDQRADPHDPHPEQRRHRTPRWRSRRSASAYPGGRRGRGAQPGRRLGRRSGCRTGPRRTGRAVEFAPLPELIDVDPAGRPRPTRRRRGSRRPCARSARSAATTPSSSSATCRAIEARAWLTQIDGIGKKTASVLLLFCSGCRCCRSTATSTASCAGSACCRRRPRSRRRTTWSSACSRPTRCTRRTSTSSSTAARSATPSAPTTSVPAAARCRFVDPKAP